MMYIHKVYLLLGSNLGNRMDLLETARDEIATNIGLLSNWSSIYETEAWGKKSKKKYLNQAIEIYTNLSPDQLMEDILTIEQKLGRERTSKWEDRLIDIDILFFDDQIIQTDQLTVPHPRIHERNFVLVPMMEIAAELIHPYNGKSIEQLYLSSVDNLDVTYYA